MGEEVETRVLNGIDRGFDAADVETHFWELTSWFFIEGKWKNWVCDTQRCCEVLYDSDNEYGWIWSMGWLGFWLWDGLDTKGLTMFCLMSIEYKRG